jgi:hypothetical protein
LARISKRYYTKSNNKRRHQQVGKKLGKNQQQSATRDLMDCAKQPKENISTTSSSTASTAACHARGLAVVHSRKLSATLRGSTSTRPGVRKLILKTYDFVDISNATIPTALGGSTTTSPPIVIVILQQQLDYIIIDYGRADRGAPDKS